MEWYLKVLKNYVVFSGRARRTEYWMFFLFNAIITIILSILQSIADIDNILTGIYGLLTILPSLAVGARRLHDSGRSGWWLLIGIIPFIGTIILIVFFCLDSEEGDNRFGANPKY
ncbi:MULTISPECIES: DUF805 domain-containing protein [Bacillaceae]|uniref:DUF805 domain-containing protein n=1 Tax=Gottfriedia luciferensis TaxID=178774 RepID=A0ABX2ZXN3_9BACI|nr:MULTISPECIES: DUF805 domain-containing protein [Bacillaceae]ODG93144.1 hypothetical protein BED47_16695 [Gottfriedia luciferensis]PGZ91737.1 DUF805 domain-containing protein [Bacillus sp. AFS029533]SFD09403.1 Uncharacterized membrane protein YhaH, DUF805 family [Bacillus sp. UNCCL81]